MPRLKAKDRCEELLEVINEYKSMLATSVYTDKLSSRIRVSIYIDQSPSGWKTVYEGRFNISQSFKKWSKVEVFLLGYYSCIVSFKI